ncbi:MAG: ATP-binding protein [Methylicorpusculum sp.]|uniref:ATP-binding protein n=1 Tax=Methylicorpusculum sp. TaxID=2713644 RepID=UPI0027172DA5|nr:ATP-binding protein [Methylicorpusculum sp.]MDO8843301.1 ATP-binding protein [Methylicorpusculum sp.]MDO8939455.1 ATP-binding protein [Methylicorpusculum sp.]MDP2201161.1 ATP-binding protein [Methylicorpusculum sp.]
MTRKKLPIGIQTFREIREDDCYYVDKTAFALKLATEGKYYFLSRPRRFGKSLFLDTLAELFAGNEVLFKGLYCHDKWDWTKQYPLIRISFGGGLIKSETSLEEKLEEIFRINSERLLISCDYAYSDRRFFAQMIQRASEKFGQRVVILIDEYDKPILDNITNPDIARQMLDGLRNFYSVIKDCDAFIRFAFLTGVSKFSKVSLFSGLNNLEDITVNAAYSAICGYSETDVDTVFAAEVEGLDRDKIKDWYNGYNWTGESVYNPFDLLLLFRERQFKPFWFETGTPTFLIDILTERLAWLPELGRLESDAELLSTFDIDDMPTEALMFQAGYLTIDREENLGDAYFYRLRFPNREVYQSLYGRLLRTWTPDAQAEVRNRKSLYRLLQSNDFEGLQNLFTAFYAGIPHDWYRNNPIAQYEGYYASVFYSYFAALGLTVTLEDATNHGRIDMTVHFNRQIYLFEFKVVELVPEGKALRQLKEKNYAEKYKAEGVPMHLIGVEFSKESRTVIAFDVETIMDS